VRVRKVIFEDFKKIYASAAEDPVLMDKAKSPVSHINCVEFARTRTKRVAIENKDKPKEIC